MTARDEVVRGMDWCRWYEQLSAKPPRGAGEWRSIPCLFPEHEDTNASASFSTQTGSYMCHAGCTEKALSCFDLALKVGLALDFKGALKFFAAEAGVVLERPSKNGTTALASLNEACVAYLSAHGIDHVTAEAWGLGYDPTRNALAIPRHMPDGTPAGHKYRVLAPSNGAPKIIADRGPVVIFGANRIGDAKRVFVCEGEIDTIALSARLPTGTAAVGAPGVSSWKKEWSEFFVGRDIVLAFDADDAGSKGAERVARALHDKATSVRVLDLRPLLRAEGKDVGDYFGRGGDVLALLATADAAQPWAPPRLPTAGQILNTDLGNARRLVARHGQDLRYCDALGGWLIWDGRRWTRDTTGKVMQRAKETIDALFDELKALPGVARDELYDHAVASQSAAALNAMVKLASTEPGVAIEPEVLDTDPMALTVLNGTVDLSTGKLRLHRREDYCTRLAPVRYDAEATCAQWDAFLQKIFEGDDALISFVRRAAGYSLTGDTSEHVFFLLYGTGRNGKGTLIHTLQDLLGDYARATPTTTFLNIKSDRVRSDLARLRGARFVTAVEVDRGKKLAEALLKEATGGDRITAAFKFKNDFDFTPAFKLWLAVNHLPNVEGGDEGIWSRILIIPFAVTIPKPDRDRALRSKLRTESSGILAWALRGCMEWQRDGLGQPQAVLDATASYRDESDRLAAFLQDCVVAANGDKVLKRDLRAAYEEWCRTASEYPLKNADFASDLETKSIRSERSHGKHYRTGIRLSDLGLQLKLVAEERAADGERVPGALLVPGFSQGSKHTVRASEELAETEGTRGHPGTRADGEGA